MGIHEETEILFDEALLQRCLEEYSEKLPRIIYDRFYDNIKLVYSVSKRFKYYREAALDSDDIIQEGMLGLWIACQRFDESKGYKFSTYACTYIDGYIRRAIRENSPIKLPQKFTKIKCLLNKYNYSLPLTEDEIDTLVMNENITREDLSNYVDIQICSMSDPIQGCDDITIEGMITSKDIVDVRLSDEDMQKIIDKILSYMKTNIYRDLLEEWMYAMINGDHITVRILAHKYNTSRTTVAHAINLCIETAKLHREEILSILA